MDMIWHHNDTKPSESIVRFKPVKRPKNDACGFGSCKYRIFVKCIILKIVQTLVRFAAVVNSLFWRSVLHTTEAAEDAGIVLRSPISVRDLQEQSVIAPAAAT